MDIVLAVDCIATGVALKRSSIDNPTADRGLVTRGQIEKVSVMGY